MNPLPARRRDRRLTTLGPGRDAVEPAERRSPVAVMRGCIPLVSIAAGQHEVAAFTSSTADRAVPVVGTAASARVGCEEALRA